MQAEFGGAAVEVERARLKNRPAVTRIKIEKIYEIGQQRAQIAVEAEQPFDGGDGFELGREQREAVQRAIGDGSDDERAEDRQRTPHRRLVSCRSGRARERPQAGG